MGDYFVRIEDSKNVRRQILESSKLCIYVLKQEHRINEIRQHKRAVIKHLRDELKELTFLLGTLEKELPVLTKKQLTELQPNAFKAPAKTAGKTAKAAPVADEKLSKLQRLDHSLKIIEKRLDKL